MPRYLPIKFINHQSFQSSNFKYRKSEVEAAPIKVKSSPKKEKSKYIFFCCEKGNRYPLNTIFPSRRNANLESKNFFIYRH